MLILALMAACGDGPYERFAHVATLNGHEGRVTCVDLDREGQWAASGSAAGEVFAWRLAGGAAPIVLQRTGEPIVAIAVSDDGDFVTSVDATGAVVVWSMDGRALLTSAVAQFEAARVRPDGLYLTYGAALRTEVLAPVATPENGAGWAPLLAIAIGFDSKQRGIVAAHDAARGVFTLAFYDANGDYEGEKVIDRYPMAAARADRAWAYSDTDGNIVEGRVEWKSSEREVRSLLYSPDEEVLAAGDALGVIRFHEGRGTVATLRGHRGAVNDLAWREDGKLLASASDDRSVMLWAPLAVSGEIRRTVMTRDGGAGVAQPFRPRRTTMAKG